ncbi:MAG: SGNH/GDSL hydrolase family protein [Aquabacterium sp.]|nr:SGNH/GDSL hydrolase family protein [Aquabacterium sp.]
MGQAMEGRGGGMLAKVAGWALKGAAGAALIGALVAPAQAQYSKVVVFSDSMSDTYRYYEFTRKTLGTGYPLSPPAMQGRFCDGPVAVEVLARELKVPLENYSFSGAQTGYGTLFPGVMLGVLTQVNEYVNKTAAIPTLATLPIVNRITSRLPLTGRADPKALHVIWSGPDDFYALGGFNSFTSYTATQNIQRAISSLYAAGARYFLVPQMPDLSITPRARQREGDTPGYIADAKRYSEQFASVLERGLDTMRALYPNARIMSFPTMSFLRDEVDKAVARGINVKDACHPGGLNLTQFEDRPVCPDPQNYLFWDDNHPTAAANEILGVAWSKAIVYTP